MSMIPARVNLKSQKYKLISSTKKISLDACMLNKQPEF